MADIRQAAKWAQEGKNTKRTFEDWVVVGLKKGEDPLDVKVILCLEDILANDWEIVE
jgi:hypothetical protein